MRDYNFFEAYQKKRNLSIDVKSPVFLGIIVIILILAVSVASVLQNVILAARLASTSIELSSIQASEEYQKAIKLQDSITAMTGYDQNAEAALQKINEGDVLGTKFLTKLASALPSTSSIQSVSLNRMTATINIDVPNQRAAAELVGNLEKSGLFLQTSLISVTKNQEAGNFTASINAILKAGENE